MDLFAPPSHQLGQPRLRMGLLFRRILECLSSGVIIAPYGELANLQDPVDSKHGSLMADMEDDDRLAITAAANTALRLIAFRQIYKVGWEIVFK